ncbi:Putative Ankyrin-3-like [Halyomorpha halys]|nr:Putative Ankyrin-3-like [Halyomorpha halys]
METARELIRDGALKNLSGHKNWEKIYSKLRIVQILLSNGIARINTQENDVNKASCKECAFDVVLVPGSSLMTSLVINVTALKNWGNKTTRDGRKPIHVISLLPDVSPKIVQFFLENGNDDVNTKTESEATPLMLAATSGNLEVVKFLVERGARVNDIASVSLKGEKLDGHFAFAKLFSKKELKDVKTEFHYSALVAACVGNMNDNNIDIINYLLSKGADVNNKGQSWLGLFHAVYEGNTKIVEILLRNGIDVNGKDMLGSTALHKAAELGLVEMAKILLKKGARLNATDALGWTPLHVASFFSHKSGIEMIRFLVQSGSNIESFTDGGYSALNLVESGYNPHFLAFLAENIDCLNQTKYYKNLTEEETNKMHTDIVDSVIQLGASLNHQDDILGWSTLHWAAASGDLDVAKLLVQYGSVVSVRSKMDRNPFETAQYFGRTKVAEFLKTAKDLVQF